MFKDFSNISKTSSGGEWPLCSFTDNRDRNEDWMVDLLIILISYKRKKRNVQGCKLESPGRRGTFGHLRGRKSLELPSKQSQKASHRPNAGTDRLIHETIDIFGLATTERNEIRSKITSIKTRTTRPALRSASGAAPGTHPRCHRHLDRRHSRRRWDYPVLHLRNIKPIESVCRSQPRSIEGIVGSELAV